ncbi:MAG: TonB family protein [Gemmatimonadales bacterium]
MSGARVFRLLAIAAPLLAWLIDLVGFLLPSSVAPSPGLRDSMGWMVVGVGALAVLLMTHAARRLFRNADAGSATFPLLLLPSLPWLAGSLVGLGELLGGTGGGPGPMLWLSSVPRIHGAYASVGLFGSAAFVLTVAAYQRRARPSFSSAAGPVLVGTVPLIAAAAILADRSGSAGGPDRLLLLANPLSALLVLPFAGIAIGWRTPGAGAARVAGLAPLASALSFVATAGYVRGAGAADFGRALAAAGAMVPQDFAAAVAAEVSANLWLSLLAGALAFLPAVVLAMQARRAGGAIAPARAWLAVSVLVVILVGVDSLVSRRTREALAAIARSGPDTLTTAVAAEPGPPQERPRPLVIGLDTVSPQIPPESMEAGIAPVEIAGEVPGGIPGGVAGAAEPVRVLPRPLDQVPPVYPPEARARGVSGIVILEVEVDSAGRPATIRVLRGIAELNSAAVEAVRRWQFQPGTLDGRPASMRRTVTVNFRL